MINIAPSIFAPKGYKARTKIGAVFAKYFENFVPGQSSAMALARYEFNNKYNVSLWNQGRLEVGTLLGILANTIPTVFYMLVRIYADSTLLQEIRDELESTAVMTLSKDSKKIMILSMREKCVLLHSTFQELLRYHARGAGARYVREDVMLNDQYLLKKGMIVQIPMAVMHFDPANWGTDVNEFKPNRFLKKHNDKSGDLKSGGEKNIKPDMTFKQNPTGYRPFGGGTSLCPGRHFVTLETLALAACMVLRFDIEPANGQWTIPPQKQESLSTNVFPPAHDIKVRVKRRKGFEDTNWGFVMS